MEARSTAALDGTPLARWGRFVHRRRGWVLAASLLLLVPTVALWMAFPGDFRSFDDPIPSTESGQASRLIVDQIPGSQTPTMLVILSDAGRDWQDPSFRSDAEAAIAPLSRDVRVTSVLTPYQLPPQQAAALVSQDGHRVLAIATLAGESEELLEEYGELRGLVESERLDVVVTGGLAFGHDFNTVFEGDLPRAEAASFPVTLVILLVVFGAVVAALLPLAIGVLAVFGGVAFTGWVANFAILPDWSVQLVSLIGLGVAIDYCLFVVNRFREELAAGSSREDALGRSLATSGHAVLFSGLTVAVSLGGLAFFRGLDWAGNGYGVAGVIGLSVLLALTLLPALLAFLGPRVNWGRIGRRAKAEAAMRGESPFWHRLAGAVMRRPVVATLAVLALVALLASPMLAMRFGGFTPAQLYEGAESRRGFEILDESFASKGATDAAVVVQWADGSPLSRDHIGALFDLSRQVARQPGVVAVESLVDFDPTWTKQQYQDLYQKPREQWPPQAQRVAATTLGQDIAVLQVTADLDPESDAAYDLVSRLRALPEPAGAEVKVTGTSAFVKDSTVLIVERLPLALGFVVVATFVLLVVQVRSLVLPLKAIVMNLLSVAASFGVTVWVFQQGHFEDLLGFTRVPLDAGNVVLMFCIIFGLSMDYEVLLLSRMHESWLRHGDNRRAVQEGLERSGRIITGAALIMVSVFGAFGLIRITFMKMFGVGLGFAILFDATVIRAILVPALMRLMGKWNWWAPAWIRPSAPAVALATASAVVVAAPEPVRAEEPQRVPPVARPVPAARREPASAEEMARVRRMLDAIPAAERRR
jgi:RND superfamily putative drug exporter